MHFNDVSRDSSIKMNLYAKHLYFEVSHIFIVIYWVEITFVKTKASKAQRYWKQNIKYHIILLTIWFGVSFGAGILFKEVLDSIKLGGFPLGFWFAQQGAIYVFVILIFVYVYLMNRLDKKLRYD